MEDDEDVEMSSTKVSTFFKWEKPSVRLQRRSLEEEEEFIASAKKMNTLIEQCNGRKVSASPRLFCLIIAMMMISNSTKARNHML